MHPIWTMQKKSFYRLCFLETEYYCKETICAILCLFSDSREQKKLIISVENDVILAEIDQSMHFVFLLFVG